MAEYWQTENNAFQEEMRSRVVLIKKHIADKAGGDVGKYTPLHWYASNGYSEQPVANIENTCPSYSHENLGCQVYCLQEKVTKSIKTDSTERVTAHEGQGNPKMRLNRTSSGASSSRRWRSSSTTPTQVPGSRPRSGRQRRWSGCT